MTGSSKASTPVTNGCRRCATGCKAPANGARQQTGHHLRPSLTPTANLFRRGHRLLVEIGSRPDLLQATALENFVYFPYHAPPYPSRNTISHDGTAVSQLTVWRLPGDSADGAPRYLLPGCAGRGALPAPASPAS